MFIEPMIKVISDSTLSLKATAFNYDLLAALALSGTSCSLVTADTPKGVLGGMGAECVDQLISDVNKNVAAKQPIGFFAANSEGNPWENAPAIASGKLAIYCGPGSVYRCYLFETHNYGGSTDKVFSTVYAPGKPLYISPHGLLTDQDVNTAGFKVGVVLKTPTAAKLELIFRSLV